MTRESASGTRTPQGPDPFSPTAQLADMADDEAQWNNVIVVDDATDRNGLSTPELRDNIIAVQKDDDSVWLCTSAAGPTWVMIASVRASGTVTAAANHTVQAATDLTRENGEVLLVLEVIRNVGNLTTDTDIGTLPAGFRPATSVNLSCAFSNGTTGWLRILNTGVMRIFFTGAAAATVYANAKFLAA